MKYKEFVRWCNERASDGMWGFIEATRCITIMRVINRSPFWRREKEWQELNATCAIVEGIVEPTNKLIEEYLKCEVAK